MKKGWYYFWFVALGLLWIYALYGGLGLGHKIGLILCIILLAPITFRVVMGYLAVVSNEKEDDYNIADDFEPFSHQNLQSKEPGNATKFCSQCGKENSASDRFCSSCGNQLQ